MKQSDIPESWISSGGLGRLLVPFALTAAAVIFAFDEHVPLGVAVGALQALPVLLVAPVGRWAASLSMAGLCTGLILVKLLLWPTQDAVPWMVYTNRALSVALVWVIAVVGRCFCRTKRVRNGAGSFLTVCAWSKKVRVGSEWGPFETYLSHHLGFSLTHGISEAEMKRVVAELRKTNSNDDQQSAGGNRWRVGGGSFPDRLPPGQSGPP